MQDHTHTTHIRDARRMIEAVDALQKVYHSLVVFQARIVGVESEANRRRYLFDCRELGPCRSNETITRLVTVSDTYLVGVRSLKLESVV